jgi:tripartite-type tricarboxylate transporter receptor subunit TctC
MTMHSSKASKPATSFRRGSAKNLKETTMHAFLRQVLAPALLAFTATWSLTASAQSGFHPTKTVRIIVPFNAGGSTDVLARSIAEKLTLSMGQPFIVDNRAGASGLIGINDVARATPDGYTLLVTNTALLQTPILNTKAGFDPIKGFAPVAQLSLSPIVFCVNPKAPAHTMAEFIALAKAKPNEYSFGSAGIGQTLHLFGEVLKKSAGIQLTHVPYKGEAPFVNELIGGYVNSGFASIAVTQAQIKAGKLRPLAVVGPARSPLLPGVPTMKEAGVAGFDLMSWFGVFAPAATPAPIVNALHDEIGKVMRMPDVAQRLDGLALTPVQDVSVADFRHTVANDYAAWGRIIRDAGIQPQ